MCLKLPREWTPTMERKHFITQDTIICKGSLRHSPMLLQIHRCLISYLSLQCPILCSFPPLSSLLYLGSHISFTTLSSEFFVRETRWVLSPSIWLVNILLLENAIGTADTNLQLLYILYVTTAIWINSHISPFFSKSDSNLHDKLGSLSASCDKINYIYWTVQNINIYETMHHRTPLFQLSHGKTHLFRSF